MPEDEYPKVIEDGVWERAQDNTAYLTERDPQNDDADKCDWAAYVQVYDSTKERIQELGYECYDAIHALSTRPFGPPSEWERTRVTCYGVCADVSVSSGVRACVLLAPALLCVFLSSCNVADHFYTVTPMHPCPTVPLTGICRLRRRRGLPAPNCRHGRTVLPGSPRQQ